MSGASAEAVALQPISGEPGLLDVTATAGGPVADAVAFGVTVRNVGGTAVTLANPYEGLTYHLISSAGTPVQVKAPPSAAKVHVPRDPAAKRAYLDVADATVDGASPGVDEFIGRGSFALAVGGAIEMSLLISSSIDPSDRSVLEKVPAGDYQLVVMLRTVVTVDDERHPLLLRTEHDLPVTTG